MLSFIPRNQIYDQNFHILLVIPQSQYGFLLQELSINEYINKIWSSMVTYMGIFQARNPGQINDVAENYKLTPLSLQLSEQQRQFSVRFNNDIVNFI